MRGLSDDFGFAFRALRARPGFVLAAVLTLALGIGANTAIFSVINAFMLKPLPYPDGERLVEVHNTYPGNGLENAGVSIPDFIDRREQAAALADTALFTWNSFNLAVSGTPERLTGLVATPSLFSTLQVPPVIGRAFTADEAIPGNEKVVVLTYDLWQNRFNGDRNIAGSDIRLNGEQYRVVGVMPEGFSFPNRDIQLYVPFAFTTEQMSDEARGNEFSMSVGRLAPTPRSRNWTRRWIRSCSRTRIVSSASPSAPRATSTFSSAAASPDARSPGAITWSAMSR